MMIFLSSEHGHPNLLIFQQGYRHLLYQRSGSSWVFQAAGRGFDSRRRSFSRDIDDFGNSAWAGNRSRASATVSQKRCRSTTIQIFLFLSQNRHHDLLNTKSSYHRVRTVQYALLKWQLALRWAGLTFRKAEHAV